MTNDEKLMQQALDALEKHIFEYETIKLLRTRLAQSEPETVIWGLDRREWQGLTDEEIEQGNKESWVTKQAWESAVWWAERKLKEKNA
mgnify:FL=1